MVTLGDRLLGNASRLCDVTLTSNREIPGLACRPYTSYHVAIILLSLNNWSMVHTYCVEHLSVRRMLNLSHAW